MGMFDNPLIKKLAMSQLEKLFSEGVTAILIKKDKDGNPVVETYKTDIVILGKIDFDNLVKTKKDGNS